MRIKKTLMVPIGQKNEFNDLIYIYSKAYRLAYAGYTYQELRKKFPKYNSQLINNACYEANNFRKTVIKALNIPKKLLIRDYAFFRMQDINYDKGEIIYKPHNRIKFEYYPSEKQRREMEEATVKGAKIVRNEEDRFMLHV